MLTRFSVRAILLAGAVLTALAFTALVAGGAMRSVRRLVIESSLERKELIAHELAADYEQFLTLHLAAVETVARHAAASPRLDQAVLAPLLERTSAAYPALWGLGVTDAAGRLVAAFPPVTDEGRPAVGVDVSDREWFHELLRTRRPVIDRRVVIGRVQSMPTITVNAPILDAAGTLRGAVTGGLRLERVRELAERLRLGRTGVVNVATAEAVLFASGAGGAASADISNLPIWLRMTEQSGRIHAYRDAGGRQRVAAFATVPGVGWKVWVSQEVAEIEDEVGDAFAALLGWFGAGLLGLVGGAALLGLVLTRPLRAVQGTAAAIAAGDLDRRAPETGPREVAGLARSFNRMAEALRARLEHERAERARLHAALAAYGDLAARVAAGDLAARVAPAGEGELAALGDNLNRMAAELERRVADLRRATDEARRERERVHRILDSITDGFVAVDRRWHLVYVNRRATEVLVRAGRAPADCLGQSLWEVFPELVHSPAAEHAERAMRDRVTTRFEARDPSRGLWHEVRVYPAADGLSIYFTDITDRRRAEEQLARFKAIADCATEAYLLCDSRTRIVYANRVATEWLGYSAEELLTLSAAVIDPMYTPELVSDLVARRRRGEPVAPFESVHRRRDGSTFPVETSLTVVELDGEPHLFAAVRDITRRKQTERQLREETEALETVHRVSRVLSAELDLHRLVQELTDAATQLTGAQFGAFFYNVVDEQGERYRLYTLSGAPPEQFAGFPMPRHTPLFGATFQGQGVVRLDDVRRDPRYGQNPPYYGLPPGHLPVVSYLAVPVVSRTGEVLGGLFFGHPAPGRFTARHERIVTALAAQAAVAMDNARLYQTEQRARAQAEAASRSKDEFLAMLSHELRTPLTAVLGWAVMLRGRQVDDAMRERALAAIERNARAQSQLIEDLLDISRIVSGKLHLDIRPLNLAAVVEAALEAVQPATQAKGVEVQSDLAPVAVVGDPQRLQQVVWNLLSNAVKFTPAGGRVTVRLRAGPEQATLVVSDTGQGIPGELLPHIFDRFRQADSSTTRRHGGLGLGLALVKHLVELHGGTVRAESAGPGRGATFTVSLPITSALGPGGEPEPVRSAAPTGVSLDGLRVLVVDDHLETLELYASWLRRRGAEVRTAPGAGEALAVFSTWRPDVLVSDIAMPGGDGYALIRKIRSLPPAEGGRIPAVALTAHGGPDDRRQALAAGFQAHVAKPVEPADLELIVAGLAGRTAAPPAPPPVTAPERSAP